MRTCDRCGAYALYVDEEIRTNRYSIKFDLCEKCSIFLYKELDKLNDAMMLKRNSIMTST